MDSRTGGAESVLRRKVLRPRPRPAPDAAPAGAERSLTRAAVKAISAVAGLSADFGAVSERLLPLDEGLERLPDEGHLVLLGAGDGAGGLVAMDDGLFAALVEAITLGRLSAQPPAPRRPTPTDAALLASVIEPILAELDPEGPEGEGASEGARGWRILRSIADPRLLRALMDEGRYRLTQAPVALSDGVSRRGGVLTLLLAAPQAGTARPRTPGAAADAALAPRPEPEGAGAAMMAAQAQLDSVLARVSLPLSQLMGLEVGHRFELPISQLEEVQLVGLDGCTRALTRLGQTRGLRAVRIMAFCEGAGPVVTNIPVVADPQSFVAAGAPAPSGPARVLSENPGA